MHYGELLLLVDAEIARLEQARTLLAASPFYNSNPDDAPARHTLQAEHKHAAPSPAVELAESASDIQVKRLRPKRTYERREKRHSASHAEDSALRSAVPAGPVVVSAASVRKLAETKHSTPVAAAAQNVPFWRPTSDARKADELLQRLIDSGSSDAATPAKEKWEGISEADRNLLAAFSRI